MSDGRKYYCLCDANCKFETMTKEQILAAIAQAAETGLVFDENAAFISKVKEINAGGFLTFWVGTQSQYNAIAEKSPNCYYHITDSTKDADIAKAIKDAVASVTVDSIGAAPMKYAKKVGAPHNLLDNSDFRNPVNQRGQTTYTSGYGIDRWYTALTVTVGDGFVRFANTSTSARVLYYRWELGTLKAGQTYTFAYKKTDGTIRALTNVCGDGVRNPSAYNEDGIRFGIGVNMSGRDEMANNFTAGTSVDLEWCAIYEGEYTAETLPEYQPKGYAAELLECQRYFVRLDTCSGLARSFGTAGAYANIRIPTEMRLMHPTLSLASTITPYGYVYKFDGTSYEVTGVQSEAEVYNNEVTVGVKTKSTLAAGNYLITGVRVDISADL